MEKYIFKDEFLGEFIGTFILVLFGLGAICASTIFGSHSGLLQVAILWGMAVTLAVYAARHICNAHFNPAVSIAMAVSGRMSFKKIPTYLIAQFLGGFLAALAVYLLYNPSIEAYEGIHGIVRGSFDSVTTAKMFGEFYVQPESISKVSFKLAFLTEVFGTFVMITIIFLLTDGCNIGKPDDQHGPLYVGITVTSVICLIAPLTQACLNPARDLGPRVVTMIFGWGRNAFPDNNGGFFWIYVLAPIIGGIASAIFFTYVVEPVMKRKTLEEKAQDENIEIRTVEKLS